MKPGRVSLLTLLFALLPLAVSAAIPAGLPSTPLWLSQNTITEGDTVGIFTVLYNQSDVTVRGTIDFSVDTKKVSSSHFELAPGKSQIMNAAWHATEGSHTIATAIDAPTDGNDNSVTLAHSDASLQVDVLPPPRTEAQKQIDATSNAIQGLLGSSSPAVENAASSTFAFTESLRNDAAKYLESKLTDTAPSKKGQVLGVSTSRDESTPAPSLLHEALQWLIRAALFIVRSVALFYPVVAALFFFFFYLLIKTVRRPRS